MMTAVWPLLSIAENQLHELAVQQSDDDTLTSHTRTNSIKNNISTLEIEIKKNKPKKQNV